MISGYFADSSHKDFDIGGLGLNHGGIGDHLFGQERFFGFFNGREPALLVGLLEGMFDIEDFAIEAMFISRLQGLLDRCFRGESDKPESAKKKSQLLGEREKSKSLPP